MDNQQRSELIGKMYDFIIDTVIKQNKLLPLVDLYGDGSRFNNERVIFEATYNRIKSVLIENKLI